MNELSHDKVMFDRLSKNIWVEVLGCAGAIILASSSMHHNAAWLLAVVLLYLNFKLDLKSRRHSSATGIAWRAFNRVQWIDVGIVGAYPLFVVGACLLVLVFNRAIGGGLKGIPSFWFTSSWFPILVFVFSVLRLKLRTLASDRGRWAYRMEMTLLAISFVALLICVLHVVWLLGLPEFSMSVPSPTVAAWLYLASPLAPISFCLGVTKGVRKWFRDRGTTISAELAVDAKHVRMMSALGINDTILSAMIKSVPEGDEPRECCFDLDKSFGGFTKAHIQIKHTANATSPHLQVVKLTRRLPDEATENDLADEWQASCDFVSDILGVRPPRIKLPDVYGLRDRADRGIESRLGVTSWVNFDLADGQTVGVGLTEPVYVMRDGKAIVASYGHVEVQLVRNGLRLLKNATTITKEIDFGPDCCDKLAKYLDHCGGENMV